MFSSNMKRSMNLVKYPLFIIAILPTVLGGHLFCCAYDLPCEHTHHETLESRPITSCCLEVSFDHKCEYVCDHTHDCQGNDQPAITPSRGINKTLKPFSIFVCDCIPVASACQQLLATGFHEKIVEHSSALPVRLHLFYRLLLI